MSSSCANSKNNKVIFIMGATGVGKSRLSIDLATHFLAEIINSDKIQIYKGLDIVANKVSESERKGLAHHLLGGVEPDFDFPAYDFCCEAISAIEKILDSNKVPIIVGGSNSFLEALVEDHIYNFKSTYESCFLWMDVSLSILHSYVSKRVDQMVDAGLVDEVRGIFHVEVDYGKGIRKAIGVPEMHDYFVAESGLDEETRKVLLASSICKIKDNTCNLVCCQVAKIKRLRDKFRWPIHRFDATPVFLKIGEEANHAWSEMVLQPCIEIVTDFLINEKKYIQAQAISATSASN